MAIMDNDSTKLYPPERLDQLESEVTVLRELVKALISHLPQEQGSTELVKRAIDAAQRGISLGTNEPGTVGGVLAQWKPWEWLDQR